MSAAEKLDLDLGIPTARVFKPLLCRSRYKGAWGGRGSGKSHFFAELGVERCAMARGVRMVCIREHQKTLKESAKRLIENKIMGLGLSHKFQVLDAEIRTPGGGVIIFQGMQDHTAESIKSLEGFDIAWVEEAQTLSATSIKLLRPTIRAPGSELWFSWNRRRKTDPVDIMLTQGKLPTGAIVVRANHNDNPWFPPELEQERLDCLETEPDQYDHIWEGGYVTVVEGSYYAKHLAKARLEGRIGRVGRDPLLPVKIFVDIGGTGGKSDAFAMWPAQFVAREIRVLNYYEAVGQEIGTHLAWLRNNGYGPEEAEIYLPHDGATNDRVYKVSYESAFRDAGYKVTVIPNQGKGAAAERIETSRRLFPIVYFNEETTEAGREALGWYHEKQDDVRNIGLGPKHDWASHGADAYGLMCIAYKPPRANGNVQRPERTRASRRHYE